MTPPRSETTGSDTFFCNRTSAATVDGELISYPVYISFNEKRGIGSSPSAPSMLASIKKLNCGTRITTILKQRFASNFKSCVTAEFFGSLGVGDIK